MNRSFIASSAAVMILAAIVLGCFWPLVRQPDGILVGPQRNGLNDLTTYFIGLHQYPRQCWDQFGQLPLWNPYRNAGSPHLGNPQTALFYPANWLCWWFDASHVLSWSLLVHHFFAGVGTFALCRRYQFSWLASLVGGGVFSAAPYLLAQTGEGHYAQVCSVAWLPWITMAYESMRRRLWLSLLSLAVAFALAFFAGHVQEWFYFALVLTAWVVADGILLWDRPAPLTRPSATLSPHSGEGRGQLDEREARPAAEGLSGEGLCETEAAGSSNSPRYLASLRYLSMWLGAACVTAALVAVELIPVRTYATQTSRVDGLSADEAGRIALNWCNWLQLFNPFALGGPDSYGGPDKFFWESLFSFGTVPLVLAPLGTVLAWRRYPVQRMAVTGLIVMAYSFGTGSPVFYLLFRVIPGLDHFRAPGRGLFICSFFVAVLSAAAIDALTQPDSGWSERAIRRLRRALLILSLLFVAAVPVAKALNVRISESAAQTKQQGELLAPGNGATRTASVRPLVLRRGIDRSIASSSAIGLLIGSCALVYLALYNKRLAQPAACTLGVLAAIQSCLIANKLLATLPNDSYQAAGSRGAATSENEAASEASAGRVLVLRTYLPDYVAQAMGIDKLQGYEPVPLSRYMQFMRALTGQRDPISVVFGDSGAEPETMNEALLDLANVRMVYQPRNRAGAVPSAFQWRADNPATVGSLPNENLNQSNEIVFFENMDAMPRAFVTGQTRVLDRSDPVGSLGALRPRDEALMTVEFLPPVARAEFGPAEIVEYSPNRVVVEVDLPAVAYVVLSDMWYPGWTATDNGRRTSVIPANVAFRAVPLSAGKHRVEFTYRPAGLWLGASVSAVAWLAVILAWGYRIVARKRWQADYYRSKPEASARGPANDTHARLAYATYASGYDGRPTRPPD